MDVPSRSHRPCVSEAVSCTEHRSSVKTVVEIHQVAVVIHISAVHIEAHGTFQALLVFRLLTDRIAVCKRRGIELVVCKSVC